MEGSKQAGNQTSRQARRKQASAQKKGNNQVSKHVKGTTKQVNRLIDEGNKWSKKKETNKQTSKETLSSKFIWFKVLKSVKILTKHLKKVFICGANVWTPKTLFFCFLGIPDSSYAKEVVRRYVDKVSNGLSRMDNVGSSSHVVELS